MESRTIKILVIDDNQDNLLSIKALINEAFTNVKIFTALNGEKGIELAASKDPDVILLDIVMPGMDGFDVCRYLKDDPDSCNIPVVFVTALKGDKDARVRALECGAEGFISKPIDESELTAQIRAMVRIKTANFEKRYEKERLETLVEERSRQMSEMYSASIKLLEQLKAENKAREKSETALKHSHDLMQFIIEHNRSAIAVHDKDLKYLYVSRRYMEDYKIKDTDIIGKHHYEVLPDLPQKWRIVHQKALAGEVSSSDEDSYPREDGTIEWTRWECRPWYEADGKVGGIIVYTEVITKFKAAEESLKKSEERYRSFITHVSEGIYRLESNQPMDINLPVEEQIDFIYDHMFIAECNDSFMKMYGMSDKKEIIGKGHLDLYGSRDNPVNREEMRGFINNGYHNENGITEEINVLGKKISFSNNSLGIIENGHLVRIWGTQFDITEKLKTEKIQSALYKISNAALESKNFIELLDLINAQLGDLLFSTNFYIALYDEKSGLLTTHNEIDEKDEINSWPAEKSTTGYVIKHQKSLLANEARIIELCEMGEIEMVGTSSKIWLGVPLIANNKSIGAIVVQDYNNPDAFTEQDLHLLEFISSQVSIAIERKRSEHDLKEALQRALESDRLKSAFLANMSHEIRTPMNGILGFTELLKEPDLTIDEQQHYISIIEKGGNRLLNIINDIINISKIESGQMELVLSETNVNDQIEYLYTFFEPEAIKKGIRIFTNSSQFANDIIINTDREKVYAILTNLIKNAIKFTNSGSIEFGYVIKGKYLEFFVKDTGVGIKKETKEIIFERFRQGSESLSRDYEGAGLGLSISKAYVELLKGSIWVESEEGKGSSFFFTLPYNFGPDENEEILQDTLEDRLLLQTNPNVSGLKILIVEDDETSEMFLRNAIKFYSKEFLRATTGIEAVESCHNNPDLDLILMDIKMPVMDGLLATRQIRQFNKEVIIIAQTAFGLTGDREKAIEAGCNDYISKPIKKDQLMELMQRYFL